jgi:hypothetical protein
VITVVDEDEDVEKSSALKVEDVFEGLGFTLMII